jgi:hypothetical protein
MTDNGSSVPGGKHDGCEYFVLDVTHDPRALVALAAYAESCERESPALYDDLNDKLARLSMHRTCNPLRRKVDGKPGGEEVKCSAPAVIPLGNGCWFCIEHALDFHVRAHELGPSAVATLKRRGAEVPPGRDVLTGKPVGEK